MNKLKIENLSKTYSNGVVALDQVSIELEKGMFGLLGPNGAGKSTLMRTLATLQEADSGTATLDDIDILNQPGELRKVLGYLPQEFGVYPKITSQQLLNHLAILKGFTKSSERKELVKHLLEKVNLYDIRNKSVKGFSGGMRQRVGIAQALIGNPKLLIVDEPTAGLDPRERIRFRNLLVELARERVVIFSTHIIEDIASSCDRVAILNKGYMSYLGVPQEMANEARGKVWQASITEEKFEKLAEDMNVIHHTRLDDGIRIRVLANEKPMDEAVVVNPTLEDAYLWLLKK